MGYKSTLRSISAVTNKAAKEAERKRKKELREQERLTKKISRLEERIEKTYQVLDDQYAKGKIGKNEYLELKRRKKDISLELFALAKTPGTSLAKRYLTGKISKSEFDEIQKEILPKEVFIEKEEIAREFDTLITGVKKIISSSKKNKNEKICWHCSKESSFFNLVRQVGKIRLCRKCSSKLHRLLQYGGYRGKYFFTEPQEIDIEDVGKKKLTVVARFNEELL